MCISKPLLIHKLMLSGVRRGFLIGESYSAKRFVCFYRDSSLVWPKVWSEQLPSPWQDYLILLQEHQLLSVRPPAGYLDSTLIQCASRGAVWGPMGPSPPSLPLKPEGRSTYSDSLMGSCQRSMLLVFFSLPPPPPFFLPFLCGHVIPCIHGYASSRA